MKDNVYFDNAATTWPKPEPVYAFMDRFFRDCGVNPGRAGHAMTIEAEQMVYATRKMLAAFFGFQGDPNRVIFTLNGTDSLNTAIAGLLKAGDHCITTRLEHNAVLRVINHLERDAQLDVTQVFGDHQGYIDPEHILSAIKPNTKAIVLTHASNVLGTVQPLKAVADIAQQHGIALIVDAAQSAGVIPIDMDALGISAVCFPGHKGLFGPMGVGGLIVAEGLTLQAQRFGGTGADSLAVFQPNDYPHRLEAGTLPLPGIAGLHAAQHWFAELGEKRLSLRTDEASTQADQPAVQYTHQQLCHAAQEHVHQVEMAMMQPIDAFLQEHSRVNLLAQARPEARVAVTSFTVDELSAQYIGDVLDADFNVCIRAGLHCSPLVHVDAKTVDAGGAVRISAGYFNDAADQQQLLDGLRAVLS